MSPERVEAFSDGVFAVIITITVLDIKAPPESMPPTLRSLEPQLPLLVSYALSFAYVGIYWNNHHHLFRAVKHVNGATMWLNLHLLFWVSLLPFTTDWIGQHYEALWPTVLYGMVLLGGALAYLPLSRNLAAVGGAEATISRMIGSNPKMPISVALYVLGIVLAFASHWLSDLCFLVVALMWFWPSRELERAMIESHARATGGEAHPHQE